MVEFLVRVRGRKRFVTVRARSRREAAEKFLLITQKKKRKTK